ncbi:major facilitator superfamily domain containing protein 5 [Apiospora rasikravindrae]|uniref:Molybdate-anion transporter n=1 Tax=Apiospora rasikravindrae TaxID=990691 RepID=A0ABR1RMH6_9PEZI
MDFYQLNLAIFAATNGYLLYRQYSSSNSKSRKESIDDISLAGSHDLETAEKGPDGRAARRFQLNFFLPYALAVAADWLQGPHIYAIYKYEKNIPEKTVAALYAAGFVSGGISASFAGGLADRFGRKRACILYCGLYIITCLTMLSDSLLVLFFGRLTGGVSTTLLFSVFEAWMISTYHEQGMHTSGPELGTVFGNMTTLSCVVAIVSGVFGDVLVTYSGTRTWPFMAAGMCCMGAAYLISRIWNENYGERSSEQTSLQDLKGGLSVILGDAKILSLGITSCVFEGTMYLFIFFWSAALKSARSQSGSTDELPYGLIFSSFMCAMMTGSAIFTLQTSTKTVQSTAGTLMTVTLIVASCLSLGAMLQDERLLFWALCLFEGCIGAYFPSMAQLKSELIEDGIRGRVYSILRFPLNVFVVVAHSLDVEGDAHRNHVFLTCASLLLVAFLVSRRYLAQ